MPKDYFKPGLMKSLKDVKKGGKIHLIGVSGVAMGQLAVELGKMEYAVSGSDKEFYEPMGSFLQRSRIEIKKGYDAANVPPDVDLVVIGNAISYGHPEVAVVEERNLPYTCFPKLLCETIITGKHSIVVAGTHGKSTTAAMAATLLRDTGREPSYFIGGVVEGFETSLQRGGGDISVVEGDEYDDVFFSKKAKFTHYKPDTFIINAIEYDHADLYPDIESIKQAFESGVELVPAGGRVVACIDFPVVRSMIPGWREKYGCEIITFGSSADADFCITGRETSGYGQSVTVRGAEGRSFSFSLPVIGEYNARNALAAIIAAVKNGVDLNAAVSAIQSYRPVKRRQQVRFDAGGAVLIEDFAHHPTAVRATLESVRDAYPQRNIWAIFEPRSNTSRRKVFEKDYLASFAPANQVILAEVTARAIDSGHALIDVSDLAESISQSGVPCRALPDAASIAEHVISSIGKNDVVVIMSNGSFGGLPSMLEDKLKEKFC